MAEPVLDRDPNGQLSPFKDSNGYACQVEVTADGKLPVEASIDVGEITVSDVTVTASALPTGAATAAKQLPDGHSVVLAAGTAGIGKLTANSGVDIGDVDVTSLPSIPAGTNLIGKVSIDQTTANANEVVVKSGAVASTQALNTGYGQAKLDSSDVTTAQALVAAVADKKFYINSIVISVAAAGSYWIEDDDAAQITCKFTLAANGGVSWIAPPNTPLVSTTANKGLKVKGSAAGVVGCMITYYTA